MKAQNYSLLRIVFALALALLSLVSGPVLSAADAQGEVHNCRFWGIISTDVPAAVIQDHLVNLPNSIKNLGDSRNPDGWAIGYYPDGNLDPTVNRGFPQASSDPNFNLAATEAANATPRIAVAHVRNTSSGITPASGDPHPFERVKDGRHWLMGHNGTIDKNVLLDLIRPDYFAANPPQYGSNQSEWIDSDLYQILVLQTLEDFNWQVKPALGYVIQRLREEIGTGTSPNTEQLNFFLTDGTTLWAYREGNSTHTLYYLYDTTGTPYSAVASQYPSASQGSWIEMSNGELITMQQDGPPVVENIEVYFGGGLLVDNYFDDSADSADLRADSAGQDWYESRDLEEGLLTLDETLVGGNGSKKAAFEASATGNAYVSQEFEVPQSGVFAVQWDIYVDEILDISGDPDRAGWMLIGDGTDPTRTGPNSDDSERFVYMGFLRDGGGTTGTMGLVARDRDDGWTSFTTVASGLSLDQWYTIRVVCDIPAGTYDVYVDDVFQATVSSRQAKTSVTHISFAQWDDGAGAFYVDNVYQVGTGAGHTLTMAASPTGGGTTDPAVGAHTYPEDTTVTITAYPNAGYEFDHWAGDVADPNAASTTVLMDGDKTVTAHFSSVPIVFLADNDFEASVDSADLRANSPGQDWYESREQDPDLLTLDETMVGGNGSKKAAFASSDSSNAYLSQEFGTPQTGVFAVQWDIYVDTILDISDPDRAGWMLIGDDTDSGRPGPNSNPSERFVQMAFHRDGGGSSGTMDLVARERGADFTAFTTVASGLNLDQWYTIRVDCNIPAGTYDVYVDGVFRATLSSYNAKTSVTHISFGQWNDGAGAFYVDNVYEVTETTHILTMAVTPTGGGTTAPPVGAHAYPEDEVVTITAYPNAGYEFDHWTGDVANPDAASTTVVMHEDQTVTAHFVPTGVPTCVTIQRGALGEVADGYVWEARPTGNNFTSSDFRTGFWDTGETRALVRFDLDVLPEDAVVQSATLGLDQRSPGTGETVHIHRITQAWSEGGPTWASFAGNYDPFTWASFASVGGDITVDVANLVAAWVSGSQPNYGMMLINSPTSAVDRYISSDYTRLDMRPWLEVCYVQVEDYTLTMAVVPTGGGMTDPAPGDHIYAEGTTVDITATPNAGYQFDNWTGDVVDPNSASTTVTMDEDKAVTAHFSLLPTTYELTMMVDPTEGGTTNPAVGVYVYTEGEVVAISATPNAGYEFDNWTGDVADPNSAGTTVTMDGDKTVTAHFSPIATPLLVDTDFDASTDSADLRANSPDQDWYESRADVPALLTLDTETVGGNGSKKAKLDSYGVADNAYLTQDFNEAQSGVFVVTMDVYVDQIEDSGTYDRAGHIYIGYEDAGGNGPNSTSNERFVFMAFYDSSPGTSGDDIVLKARTSSTQAYGTTSQWTNVTTGLSYDTWYTIKIECDVTSRTYDVYVDDLLTGNDIPAYSGYASSSVTHISFVADSDGRGTFYVDDVSEDSIGTTHTLTMAADPTEGGTTAPTPGGYIYIEGATVDITATPNAGYQFDNWTGGVANPNSASTTVTMDGDKTVTAHFSLIPAVFLADNDFDASVDSADLRANGPDQDWYESRGDVPTLLFLDETTIGGNSTKKAGFTASATNNAYVSQEFGTPQTGVFAVQWDIYVDQILDILGNPDRAGWMLIGDDTYSGGGPNANNSERFVYLGFYRDGGGSSGTMNLVARDRDDGWTSFTTVATGLNLDQWHTILVVCDLDTDTYDVYVDGEFQATVSSRNVKGTVTHISFAQWNDGAGAFYVDNVYESAPPVDSDGDGVPDDVDNCPDAYNPGQEDADGDGLGDACDDCTDVDADGVCDDVDNCPDTYNPGQEDADGDGLGDACDDCTDVDADGVCDDVDNCPAVYNPGQEDSDGDGMGDACDACPDDPDNDADGDGVCGDVDNCPAVYNPGQEDADGDGLGDACDDCTDVDADGVCDDVDNCPAVYNPGQEDSDGDGMGDACDACPYDPDNDADGDGVCGDVDNCPNTYNPDQADSDGDGIGDACEEPVEPTCVTIQRGAFGEVADGYIWQAYPTLGKFTEARLRTGLYTHPNYGSGENRTLIRFSLNVLPENAVVQSATFGISQLSAGSGETVNIYRITEDWSEGGPTWDNFASNYDSSVVWSSFVASGGLRTADVTSLVSAWLGGVPNYGMMLINAPAQALDEYFSSDFTRDRPWLEVCYSAP